MRLNIASQKLFFVTVFFALLGVAALVTSCSSNSGDKQQHPDAKGGKVYGGYLKLSNTDSFYDLLPIHAQDIHSAMMIYNVFDGLVKFNMKTLEIEPNLAEKWQLSPDGLTYTFQMKKGVFFHDDPCFIGGKGRELKAQDVKYSFELLCSDIPENHNFPSTLKDRLLGANEFFSKKKTVLEGVKIIDDYTLELKLYRPSPVFLHILAQTSCTIIAKEAFEKYHKNMKTGGSGPFIFDAGHSVNEKVVLRKNFNYHNYDKEGNRLPFLDSIVIYTVPSKEQELEMFKAGKLDVISSLPSQSVKEMMETNIKDFQSKPPKYVLDNSPEMVTQFYGFNCQKYPFDNVKVRQALNYAINRQKIVDDILIGQAFGPGIKGITPPTFMAQGYDIAKITGYDFNPEKARALLAEAGFPDGKGFPQVKVILNSGGARNSNVVVEIQKQLMENLHVNVDFDVIPFKNKLEESQAGRFDIVREGWVADFPSPETFLQLFYGEGVPDDLSKPSYPNTTRYRNAKFDKLFLFGRDAISKDSALNYFLQAERIIMEDAPILVLWYEGNFRMHHFKIKGTIHNPMHYKNFSEVYIQDSAQKSAQTSDSLNKS